VEAVLVSELARSKLLLLLEENLACQLKNPPPATHNHAQLIVSWEHGLDGQTATECAEEEAKLEPDQSL